MRRYSLMLFRAMCFMCITSAVIAGEQRVLMSFDSSGHHVRHIVNLDAPLTLRSRTGKRLKANPARPDINALISQLQPGFALLVWTDADGNLQLSTQEPDPRVSRAPAHITGSGESRLGQTSGAWLVIGPDIATGITILLPSDPFLGLAFEQWEVVLVSE